MSWQEAEMPTDSIETQASRWLARLDAVGETPELVEAIRAWRGLDPLHDAEFLRLQATWARLDRLASTQSTALQEVGVYGGGARGERPASCNRPPWGAVALGRTHRAWGVAASVLVVCISMLVIRNERPEEYATSVGGLQRVSLTDGSIIEINTDSEIRVSLRENIRAVELVKGEALFTVAPDPDRPFVVTVGDASVRAVGTQFNVHRLGEEDMEVLVTEGKVMLVSGEETTMAPLVAAGHKAAIVRGGEVAVGDVSPTELNRKLAWQAGKLVFAGEPLRDAILELNRYNERQLQIDDPLIEELRIGGYFNPRNLDGFIAVLQNHFGIEASAIGDRIVLRRKLEPN